MLKKRVRLTAKDIESLSQGTSVFGTLVSLRVRPADALKVSVSVSKKDGKTAVIRNRMRRRAYAAVEKALPAVRKSAFVLVMPKKAAQKATFSALCEEIKVLFAKARLTA